MSSKIILKYLQLCETPSDINEHLPTLREYASKVNHITECGVRNVVSSYAFASGLLNNKEAKFIQVDIETNENITTFSEECGDENINIVFYNESDLTCPLEKTELLFIDTWHVYGHLKRELIRWSPYVMRYIIMHDTTIDEVYGEGHRMNSDIEEQSKSTGLSIDEINKGLWPAISEFLENNKEWSIEKRFTNNNGLTILSRKD